MADGKQLHKIKLFKIAQNFAMLEKRGEFQNSQKT